MACFYPIPGWRSFKATPDGTYPIVFQPGKANLDLPLSLPCGKCDGCAADRALMWSIRITHEAMMHEQNSFVTLTYRDPAPPVICKKDLQDFFKRLRHTYPCRYFACGEYGDRTRRPHYHACIFGQDFLGGAYQISDELYGNPILERIWKNGMVSIGRLEPASASYVAGYCNKKLNDPDTFSLMSNRPGLGKAWLEKNLDSVVRLRQVIIDGRELPIPKQYFNWAASELRDVRLQRLAECTNISIDEVIANKESLPSREANRIASLKLRSETL